MSLADDIRALRLRVLTELAAAHDYYEDSKIAWDIVKRHVATGNKFTNQSQVTGTITNERELVDKAKIYVTQQLAEATFQLFVAIFENFFFELLRLWLTAYPRHLLGKQVAFRDVLDAPDKEAITEMVVQKELNEVLYRKPADWFAYFDERVKLGCPTAEQIEHFAEAKAERDALAHNRGVVGRSYLLKAGRLAQYRDGERIDLTEPYHRQTWELLCLIVDDIAQAAEAKAV
jgi:hypothetical protein